MATDAIVIKKMIKYCDDATKYVGNADYDAFVGNELFLTFSVFALSQLGEMACRLDDDFYKRYQEIPWRAVRGVRNRIVHDYDGIKFNVLWDVLIRDIPLLRQQLINILPHLDAKV